MVMQVRCLRKFVKLYISLPLAPDGLLQLMGKGYLNGSRLIKMDRDEGMC